LVVGDWSLEKLKTSKKPLINKIKSGKRY